MGHIELPLLLCNPLAVATFNVITELHFYCYADFSPLMSYRTPSIVMPSEVEASPYTQIPPRAIAQSK